MNVPIVCPTHGRAGNVRAFAAFGDDLILAVAESQAPAYRAAYPDAKLDVHSDKIKGISPKRQWLYEKYGTMFMVDDDCTQMIDVTGNPVEKIEPAMAVEIVERTADMAEQMGIPLWGLSTTENPLRYQPHDPIRLTEFVSGAAMGLHPSKHLFFPDDPMFPFDDGFLVGLNFFAHRLALKDTRYVLPQHYNEVGGIATFRTTDVLERARQIMKNAFGDAAVFKDEEAGTDRYDVRVAW